MKRFFNLHSNKISLLICISFFILQIPFLNSDPDKNITTGRGPNTDEGLYSCQIRNYINHHDLTFYKSDGILKTPFLSVISFIPFLIFGTKLLVARLTVLLLSLAILFLVFKNKNYTPFGIIMLLMTSMEYYIFHYFHFCLAEIFSTVLILAAIYFFTESIEKINPFRSALITSSLISLSYFIKIQFLYTLLILPLAIVILILTDKTNRQFLGKQLFYTILFLFAFLTIFFFVWYLPNKDFFSYMWAEQTANRIAGQSEILNRANSIIKYYFYNNYLFSFTISFFILFPIGVIYTFFSDSIRFRFFFIALTCWFLIELHKLSLNYLPSRYLVSLIFCMGSIIALVINEFIFLKSSSKLIRSIQILSIIFLITIGIKNGIDYTVSFRNREFEISKIDDYLSHYNFGNKPILGAWAPSLCWKSNALTLPVWMNYFNDKNVIEKFHPRIIIAETDERDSDKAYSTKGIDLNNLSDSTKTFSVNNWNLKLYWIKQ